jgi:hypothetical protein
MMVRELTVDAVASHDPEVLHHAAKAVFHYFKLDLGMESVTVGEFAKAFEKVLQGIGLGPNAPLPEPTSVATLPAGSSIELDLRRMALKSGPGSELFFFPLLRTEMQRCLASAPKVVRFVGLRGCVKQLMGARRWGPRCQALGDRIVWFLREKAAEHAPAETWAMVVE